MIVAKIELWPCGSYEGSYELGRVVIVNDGTGDKDFGNYNVRFHTGRSTDLLGVISKGRVKNFKRSLGVFNLLLKSLKGCKV
uniref:Uncharacterized protein n=1 Tax=viral metagenome TaxID=1070528 RepID=A0A6M3KT39_9ZZZZ